MPSIPQSLLWISLVVLWLFVLVPMLINKRDTVRRTSDLALSTRVVNSASRSRLLRRRGPATGHRHDPDWRPEDVDLDEDYQDYPAEDYDEAVREAMQEASSRDGRGQTRSAMVLAAVNESEANTEPVYIDVDVVDENSGALPVGDGVQADGVQESLFEQPPGGAGADADAEDEDEHEEPLVTAETDTETPEAGFDEYEYVEDTSGLEAEDESDIPEAPRSNRRRRMESTAAAVTARKYRFRKRVLTAMAAIMVLTAVLSFTVSASLWWACGSTAAVTLLYLGYLRRQVRIEEQVRRRRQQRMMRSRMAGEPFAERSARAGFDVDAARLRRPGAVVLDIDDEDPVFEHLDEMPYSRRFDLPRAAGQ
ncbi:MAG: hypothetical protein K8R24_12760 [Mycobacterium sp.]|nr:hypothetical protein [Mycobacterium sp.]